MPTQQGDQLKASRRVRLHVLWRPGLLLTTMAAQEKRAKRKAEANSLNGSISGTPLPAHATKRRRTVRR
jgi:hypothetical protein